MSKNTVDRLQYFDIHGHVNFAGYDADRAEVIKRARALNVGMITVGTDLATSESAIRLAEENEGMWATVGLHPVFTGESHNDPQETGIAGTTRRPKQEFDRDAFKKLAAHSKVIAIGECGLDYFHSKPEELETQRKIFIEHIQLANEVGKPLMLHVRNGKGEGNIAQSAYREAIELLKAHSKVKANIHFFAGTFDDMKAAIDAGCSISFTGVITFAKNYEEVIRQAPIEHMMTETDCPYVSPAPYRGKRNEPSYVIEVVKKIAEIKGMALDRCQGHLAKNAVDFFGLA